MRKVQVRMADIAQKVGVSTVAVSKALSGQKGVSEDTRAQILAAAEELGYRYPAEKRRDAIPTGYHIGVVMASRYLNDNEAFYWKLYREVAAQVQQAGSFTLLELLSEDDARAHRLPKLVTENQAEALMVIGKPPCAYAETLHSVWDRPLVFLDFYDATIRADAVLSNSYYGTYALTNLLMNHGHREIAFVGTLLATDSITDRYQGYVRAMMEHRLPVRPEWVISDRNAQTGMDIPLVLPERMPTAFVCNCDMTAERLIRTLAETGRHVPEDVSVVGFDNFLPNPLGDISLTTYAVDMTEMAVRAVRNLLDRLAGRPTQQGLQITGGKIVERNSVGTAK